MSTRFVSFRAVHTMVCLVSFWLQCMLCITLATSIRPKEEHDHHDHNHDHHDHHWEWAGRFDVHTDQQYTWVASKVNGAYADPTMKMLIVSANSSSSDGIEGVEAEAEELFEAVNATQISAPSSTVLRPGTLYELVFDTDAPISLFYISFSTSMTTRNEDDESNFIFFTEHDPVEFENGVHYLLDAEGNDVELVATEPATTTTYNNAGWAVLASFCVALASCFGMILIVPAIRYAFVQYDLFAYVSAFASGAILALTFFLVIPESLLNIASRHPGENSRAAWFGSMLLGGFISVVLIDWLIRILYPSSHMHAHPHPDGGGWSSEFSLTAPAYVAHPHPDSKALSNSNARADVGPNETPTFVGWHPTFHQPTPTPVNFQFAPFLPTYLPPAVPPSPYMAPNFPTPFVPAPEVVRGFFDCCPLNGVVWSATIGDGLHNFVDGVLIGFAFRYCGQSLGWTVAAAALFHELAAELSEFYLMIDPTKGRLSWLQALTLNFLASLTIIMGAVIVSYVDISPYALGLILAYSAGVLLNLAIVPIWHSLLERHITWSFMVIAFLSFAIGATAIGLVLLYHQHCDAGSSHAGHNH